MASVADMILKTNIRATQNIVGLDANMMDPILKTPLTAVACVIQAVMTG